MHRSGEQHLFVDIFQLLVVIVYCDMPSKYVMVKLNAGMDDGVSTSLFISCRSGASSSLKLGMNFDRYVTNPKKRRTPSLSVGGGMLLTASFFAGSGFNPSVPSCNQVTYIWHSGLADVTLEIKLQVVTCSSLNYFAQCYIMLLHRGRCY